jgi:proline racemase
MKSFEYHVGGQPVRRDRRRRAVAAGRTQAQKAAWFARHADRYRRGLVLAPRGHLDMSAVLLTEPSSPGARGAGVPRCRAAARASPCRGDRRRDAAVEHG